MAQPARFTFDLNLEPRGSGRVMRHEQATPPGIPEDLVAQLVAEARREAYAEGLAAGETNATTMAAQTLAAAAATLATQTASMAAALDETIAAHRSDSVDLALTVGRKLALHLIARFPRLELEALVAECMSSIGAAPHLVIRCHPDLAEHIREAATAQMTHSGFAGRLVVMGDPDIRIGDGRLEWVDGGIVRDIAQTAGEIDRQIRAYLAAFNRADHSEEHGR